jgi:hypothetical protein
MLIALMGYNRGANLRLAVDSIERNLPGAALTIVDDNSTCPDTVALLRELAPRHRVIVSRAGNDRVYLRGLHVNMNAALELALREKFDYIFFIQDDQQIVRPLDEVFFGEMTGVFRSDRAIAQVMPSFFKGFYTREALAERFAVDEANGIYHCRGASQFSIGDTGITSLARLEARQFRFDRTEHLSGQTAQRLGLRFVLSRNPVFMYTPWPATARDHPEIIRRFNLGVHPFDYMTEEEIARLRARPAAEFPIAETHLRTADALRRPWWYTAINKFTVDEYNSFLQKKREQGEL